MIGHIGLTPQTSAVFGGFKTQGRTSKNAVNILDDALVLQDAGCSMILIECVPPDVTSFITSKL